MAKNDKQFHDALMHALESRALTTSKLAELTGIHDRYIEALRAQNYSLLPSLPYVRGYLRRIANVLHEDGELWWQLYKAETEPVTSGAQDHLPRHRFLLKKVSSIRLGVLIIFLAAIGLGIYYFNVQNGKSKIIIDNPSANTLIVHEDKLEVSGRIESADQLFINNEPHQTGSDGVFKAIISLTPGINTIEFMSKRLLGSEVSIVKKIIYEPPVISTEPAIETPIPLELNSPKDNKNVDPLIENILETPL